jgi:hypothetical protein
MYMAGDIRFFCDWSFTGAWHLSPLGKSATTSKCGKLGKIYEKM